MAELAHSRRHRGIVSAFDAPSGLGVVRGDDGVEYPFHCIEIADGTREIEAGTAVTFSILAKLGRYEAAEISG